MSESNRRQDLTVGLGLGLLAGLFVGGYIYCEAVGFEEYARYQPEYYTGYYEERADEKIAVECVQAEVPERARCAQEIIADQREEARKEYDLEAQGVMAAWTRAMGQAALVAMIVGIFGLGLLYTTFRETRRAASAASAANTLIQTAGERQDRAYLTVDPGGINKTKTERAVGDIIIRNVGKIPAKNVQTFVRLKRMKGKQVGKLAWPKDGVDSDRTIQPGGEMRRSSTSTTAVRNIDDPKAYVFVWGIITYDDGFGEKRYTRFCHRYPGAWTAQKERQGAAVAGMAIYSKTIYADELIPPQYARHHNEFNDAT